MTQEMHGSIGPSQNVLRRLGRGLDARLQAITAGLDATELAALLRGAPPTERPNPRFLLHTNSLLFHMRPRTYAAASTWFTHTFRLGLLSVLLFVIETITGLILMLYYAPTPDAAYASILRLESQVPFGSFLRDVHRLGAEAMVAVVVLHTLRVYMTGAYKGPRSFTWLTGVVLLLITLLLAFSGYLLPWDQLAYWAVTIGTSMAAAIPVFGREVNLLLRGAPDIGADGLLRFYLLHVVLLPLAGIILISVHYYKVARHHGISLPAKVEEGDRAQGREPPGRAPVRQAATRRIPFMPDLFLHELFITAAVSFLLIGAAVFFYDAPLESQADPRHTPLDTRAPWFFLWVQGLLKLGDKTLMGVALPGLLLALLLAAPYLDPNPQRMARKRPVAVALGALVIVAVLVLSYMGTPGYGIEQPAAVRIVQDLAPEEREGPLHRVPYDDLLPGVYAVGDPLPASLPDSLGEALGQFAHDVTQADATGALPQAGGFVTIEERQQDLKAITVRIVWQGAQGADPTGYERTVYLHRERTGAPPAAAE